MAVELHFAAGRPRADVGLQKLKPSAALADHVESVWAVTREQDGEGFREKVIYPDGGIGLFLNLGDPLSLNGERISSKVFVDGTRLGAASLGMAGTVSALGVRFRPCGAWPLLDIPPGDLPDPSDSFDAVEVNGLDSLWQRLGDVSMTSDRMRMVEAWLMGRLEQARRCSPVVTEAVRRLRQSGGQVLIQDLSDWLDIGRRQLERLFVREVGISPKRLARIIRVSRAKSLLKQARDASGAEIGCMSGYFDQAHFIRDFSSVVGLTPMAYLDAWRQRDERCVTHLVGSGNASSSAR